MKFFTLCFCSYICLRIFVSWPNPMLRLIACDVGQGDAFLLSIAHQQVLIDVGPDESVLSCLHESLPFWDKKIDILVLTHFDADHFGGLTHISNYYEFGLVFLPLTESKDSQLFLESQQLLTSLQAKGTRLKQPFLGQQISLLQFSPVYQAKYNSMPQLVLSFLTPINLTALQQELLEENGLFLGQKTEHILSVATWDKLLSSENTNDGSIALFITFGQIKMIFLGDLEEAGELALVAHGLITRVNIQKVGHHGSKTSSHSSLLELSQPEVSLISAGKQNKFGHPHPEVIARLQAIGSQVWRTDVLGSIEIRSNGHQFWLHRPKTPSSSL